MSVNTEVERRTQAALLDNWPDFTRADYAVLMKLAVCEGIVLEFHNFVDDYDDCLEAAHILRRANDIEATDLECRIAALEYWRVFLMWPH